MTTAHQPLPQNVEWRTPFDLLRRNATLYPNKLALVAANADGGETRLSYAALSFAIDKAADALRNRGLRPDDHLAILMTNHAAAEYVLIAWGAMRLGAVVVPLNARFAVPELRAAIEDMDCGFLIHESGFDTTVAALNKGDDRFAGRTIRVGADGDWAAVYAAGI
ncbi:MAG: acyl--CoA ligase, partial [Gammaproteobacteria bacterium]|nr:acyl--CoA ligase [Gammaproteobacteria bacterium]